MTRLALAVGLAAALTSACTTSPSSPSTTVTALQIKCDVTTITEGQKATCTATATFGDNSTSDQTGNSDWTSSDSTVATVSKGSVTAVTAGTADINAKLQSATAKQTFTIKAGPR